MQMVEIEYRWSAKTSDPNEIIAVTFSDFVIPRIGELVDINTLDGAKYSGRVADIVYNIGMESRTITVLLQ